MSAVPEEMFGPGYANPDFQFLIDCGYISYHNEEMIEVQHVEDNACVVVYFDLETSGFGRDAEILQIAAMYGDCTFSVYISPQNVIPWGASLVNGLTEDQGNLLLNGSSVSSVPLQTGLTQFYSFLNSTGKKCVLTAHNCKFDQSHLIRAIESANLIEHFKHLVYGFSDTLPIIRAITGTKERGANTLVGLANSLSIPYSGAHNAINDVAILIQIIRGLSVSDENIIENCESWDAIIKLIRHNDYISSLIKKLGPIQYVVSYGIRKKIVVANITYEMMKKAYTEDKVSGLQKLLIEVTKSKSVTLKLANFLEINTNF